MGPWFKKRNLGRQYFSKINEIGDRKCNKPKSWVIHVTGTVPQYSETSNNLWFKYILLPI